MSQYDEPVASGPCDPCGDVAGASQAAFDSLRDPALTRIRSMAAEDGEIIVEVVKRQSHQGEPAFFACGNTSMAGR